MFEGSPPMYFQVLATAVVIVFTVLWVSIPLSALIVFFKKVFQNSLHAKG